MDPTAFYEDTQERKRRMLPQALGLSSPDGVLTQTVRPGRALPMSMRERLGKVYEELDKTEQDPDMSGLQAFARQQGEQGQAAMLNALAAQYAGQNFQPVQAQFLRRAMSAQEPMKVGGGMLTPDGQFVRDPMAARDARRAQLERQATGIESMIQQQERAEQARQDRLAQQQRDYDLRAEVVNLRRDQANNRGDNVSFTQSGFTPDGKQLVTNKTGMNFVLEMGPQGQPVYTPYTGAAIPKTTFDKNVGVVQEAIASAARSDQILNTVEQNPDAFGITAAAVSRLPQFAQGRVGSMVLDENTMKLRSDVLRAAAMEISSLYGAALSLGEQARANTFIPNQDDPPQVVIQKLKAARDWAKGTAQQFGGGVLGAAQARSAGGQQAPAPAAGGLSAEEQAEYERLKKKYGR